MSHNNLNSKFNRTRGASGNTFSDSKNVNNKNSNSSKARRTTSPQTLSSNVNINTNSNINNVAVQNTNTAHHENGGGTGMISSTDRLTSKSDPQSKQDAPPGFEIKSQTQHNSNSSNPNPSRRKSSTPNAWTVSSNSSWSSRLGSKENSNQNNKANLHNSNNNQTSSTSRQSSTNEQTSAGYQPSKYGSDRADRTAPHPSGASSTALTGQNYSYSSKQFQSQNPQNPNTTSIQSNSSNTNTNIKEGNYQHQLNDSSRPSYRSTCSKVIDIDIRDLERQKLETMRLPGQSEEARQELLREVILENERLEMMQRNASTFNTKPSLHKGEDAARVKGCFIFIMKDKSTFEHMRNFKPLNLNSHRMKLMLEKRRQQHNDENNNNANNHYNSSNNNPSQMSQISSAAQSSTSTTVPVNGNYPNDRAGSKSSSYSSNKDKSVVKSNRQGSTSTSNRSDKQDRSRGSAGSKTSSYGGKNYNSKFKK